jgi:glycosyltransferase involved in cell wall biosynthesis
VKVDMSGSLNILHVMRAPVGGLFRHVIDLARGQIAQGHCVGIVADSSGGGMQSAATLAELAPKLALGLMRVAMSRQVGPKDVAACAHVARRAADVGADVVHGHGAKGGAYARLVPRKAAHGAVLRVYTPHGGSLHYRWSTPTGLLYLTLERALRRRTDLFLFESAYGLAAFRAKLGEPGALVRVVHNGVDASEFAPVNTDAGASDLIFVGELRMLKGVDVLIKALAILAPRKVSATIVGEGPDRPAFEAETAALGLASRVRFVGVKPARAAFALGRLLVIPSRAESLPYIVLEAAAAGMPLITTKVGGIPEIFGSETGTLIQPGDPAALAQAIDRALQDSTVAHAAALRLQARVREHFSADRMTDAVLATYADALARRRG